jgi:hypothetical protein
MEYDGTYIDIPLKKVNNYGEYMPFWHMFRTTKNAGIYTVFGMSRKRRRNETL